MTMVLSVTLKQKVKLTKSFKILANTPKMNMELNIKEKL